jgi:hypothetical protein
MELIYIFVISNSDFIVICLIGSYLDNIRRTLLNTTHKVLCSTITCHDYWSLSSVIVIVVIFIVVVVDIITSITSRLMSHVSSSSPPPKLTWLPPFINFAMASLIVVIVNDICHRHRRHIHCHHPHIHRRHHIIHCHRHGRRRHHIHHNM